MLVFRMAAGVLGACLFFWLALQCYQNAGVMGMFPFGVMALLVLVAVLFLAGSAIVILQWRKLPKTLDRSVAIIHCPACQQSLSNQARTCPGCGHPVGRSSENYMLGVCVVLFCLVLSNALWHISGFLGVLVLVGLCIYILWNRLRGMSAGD